MLDDRTEPQLVPKLLRKVSVRELHDILVSYPNDGGLKYTRDKMVGLLSVIIHCIHCYQHN